MSKLITPQTKIKVSAETVEDTGATLYPHLKITAEEFPRLLATRRILNKKDEYFGAFVSKTAFRIRFYHLNRIFKLRTCQLEIDGNFSKPCQMFYTKKCVAPCVSAICTKAEYDEFVEAMRLFLREDDKNYEKMVVGKIDEYADNLEFEKAARWRDIWRESQDLKSEKTATVSLENAVDTYSYEEENEAHVFHLITTRGRKLAGNEEFVFEKSKASKEESLESILKSFYPFSAPREIRLPFEISDRKGIEKAFREKFKNQTKITIINQDLNTTAKMRLTRTRVEHQIERLGEDWGAERISNEFRRIFSLKKPVRRIEAYDVAHLAGLDFITANAVWQTGEMRKESVNYWKTGAASEPQAMAEAVRARLEQKDAPDLILIDGGRGQLNAVLSLLDEKILKRTAFVSAVKPPKKHSEVSHFLTREGSRIDFIPGDRLHELLRNLRDEAHRTANELHRQFRDNKYIFAHKETEENAADEIPLVIIRFDEPNGAAEDLQPIKTDPTRHN